MHGTCINYFTPTFYKDMFFVVKITRPVKDGDMSLKLMSKDDMESTCHE